MYANDAYIYDFGKQNEDEWWGVMEECEREREKKCIKSQKDYLVEHLF